MVAKLDVQKLVVKKNKKQSQNKNDMLNKRGHLIKYTCLKMSRSGYENFTSTYSAS